MPQIINTNLASLNAQRNLNNSQADQSTALQRLSSGLRINSAKDDAAGLAISTRFETQVEGLTVAIRNANDGVSLAQVAEGALGSLTSNLQRIRELALQSANDTNSALDREALNAEVQQLLQEVESVSEDAAFNGRKLLDGSFEKATFQTGANVGDTISFTIAEASVETLGTSSKNGISSFRTTTATPALTAGDLVINGVAVGSSLPSDDTASTDAPEKSAIAMAAAINRVSDKSEVTASVNANTVGGRPVSGNAAANTITINGESFTITTSAGGSPSATLSSITSAINEKSGVTGVRAEVAGDSDGGVNLIADDGRNIQLGGTTAALENVGLAQPSTYIGTYSLLSKAGDEIEITSDSGNILNAGLQVGDYSGGNSGVINGDMDDTTAVGEGDLVINGVSVGALEASLDNASTSNPDKSAISLAAAINKIGDKAGVTAVVGETRVNSGNVTAASAANFDLNGVTISISQQSDVPTQLQALVGAVNAVSGQTGVTAEVLDGDSYTLIAADGRNIDIAAITGGLNSGFSAPSLTQGAVTLESAGPITLSTNTGNIGLSGFTAGVYGGSESGQRLKDIDISTVQGALDALAAVDNALQSINIQRADLGAIQNRFESAISSQAIARENLSAANSRIKDADFAEETAALSRAQVLQQAGTTILAQANGLPQQVLSLLQG